MSKNFQTEKHFRTLLIKRDTVDAEKRTVELAFSSETPVERYFGIEILDHAAGSVQLDRLNSAAPLLMDHDTTDQIGVIEKAEIGSDRVGRATVRFGKGTRADEVFQDVLDGIRTKVSVGYTVSKWIVETGKAGEQETYRFTEWQPFEISIVAVPADNAVGVGRDIENILNPKNEGNLIMEPKKTDTPAAADPTVIAAEVRAATDKARADELTRVRDIETIGQQFTGFGAVELARKFIAEGNTVAEFHTELLKRLGKKEVPSADIGLTEQEAQSFSFLRAIYALANPNDKRAQEAAAFEREAGAAAAQKMGRSQKGIMVPMDVLKRVVAGNQRGMTVGTAANGGYTVETDLRSQDFITLLRNKLITKELGATMLTGLVGNVAIPRMTGGATAYWVGEDVAPTASNPTFDQVTMSPKTIGGKVSLSRLLLLQSSLDVEAMVRDDLATVLALGIDLAAINGSGSSGQPLGILGTSGIGSVVGGTNGAVVTYNNIVDLETAVATANADLGRMAYLINAKQRGVLKKTPKISGYPTYIWDGGDSPLNGYKTGVSNQVPSNLTKGTASGICSANIFGNWADLVIGQWGGLDLTIDPYSSADTGNVRVVALQDVDIAVRHAASFAAMQDAL